MMRLDYIDRLTRMKEADLDALARSKREDWHVNCEWVIGTLGIAPGLGYLTTFNTDKFEKYPPLGDFDLIREYLPYAHKYGIRVLAYLNMHWFAYDFADRNPGWEQLLADGTPYGRVHPLYGNGTTFCVNSGWRSWAEEMVAEVMKTGLDGVFLDGPVVYPGCCHCPACRKQFASRYGAEIPASEDWADPRWKDFIEFREDSLAQFLSSCRAAMKSVNPDGVIFLNAGSWHAGSWRVARDIEKVGEFEDFNGAEAFFHPGPRQHILHFWATAAKHLVAGGKPTVVFSHHALGSWHYVPLPPVEAKLAIAQTVACGANPWIAVFDYALDNGRELAVEPIREIHSFLEKHDEYYTATESAADVALLYSRQTSTFYLSDLDELYGEQGSGEERDLIADVRAGRKIEDLTKRKRTCDEIHSNSYLGWFTALTRAHIPFDVILDPHLTPDVLSRYRTLILPNAACLSDSQIDAVINFVQQGGGLVAEFETGSYDERGCRRPQNPLLRMLGVGKIRSAMMPATGEEYVKVSSRRGPTASFASGQLIARPQFSLQVTRADSSDVLMTFMEQIGQLYSPLKGETSIPALLTSMAGSGRTVYMPFLAGDFYARYRMWEYQELMAGSVRWVHPAPFLVDVECPQTVEVEVRSQPDAGRLLIHLVNNSGDMQRPMSEIVPVHDLRLKVRRTGVRRVHALSAGIELAFEQDDDSVQFVLPELHAYEVIVVE